MLSEPFFNQLRTQQQLGYIVNAALAKPSGVYHLDFLVQSSHASSSNVTASIHTFLAQAHQLVSKTSTQTLDNLIAAARARLLRPPRRLSQLGDNLWTPIA